MPSSNLKYLFVLAMLMSLAKPFVGFSLCARHYFQHTQQRSSILVKSFAKRKLEYRDDSGLNPAIVLQRLANPSLPLNVLFIIALAAILPAIFKSAKAASNRFLLLRLYHLSPPEPLYLLSGKLII